MSFQKIILYLIIISGFFGSAFLSIDIGSFSLFPFRISLLLLWLVFICGIFLKKGKLNISNIKIKEYFLFFLFWICWTVLSLGWVENKEEAFRDIIFLFMGCSLIFFAVFYLRNLRDLKWFYYIWIVVLIILIPVGIWEHLTGSHLTVSGLTETVHPIIKFMPTAVFHNPNDFAAFLVLCFPFLFSFLRYHKKILKYFFGIILIVCSLYLLFFTYSRASYLALIFEFLFLFIFLFKLKLKIKVIVATILILLAIFTIFPKQIFQSVDILSEQIISLIYQTETETASVGVRINLIKNSFLCLSKSFCLGIGAGNIEHCIENYGVYETGNILNLHNWWFEILTEYGIFVFMGYVIFYLSLIWFLYKKYKTIDSYKQTTEKMICEALLVALVGFFLASISPSSIMAFKPQWLLFAFSLAFLNYQRLIANNKVVS